MVSRKVSRRRFVAGTAVASTALVAAPFVRSAYAAGKLSIGFWDHWVPGANKATTDLVKEWADKEKVEVTIDYITSQGNKLLLTTAAESQAKSGHDILAFSTWLPSRYAEQLVPMNDIVEPLIKANGAVNGTVEYLGKLNGKWLAVPATVGSQIKGPCSRIDYLKKYAGIDKFLVSGQGSLIMNPPSAWAVAKRDAPQVAEQLWTHGFPAGPKGRYAPFLPFFWGVWNFSKNQAAAKSLLTFLSQASSAEKMVVASGGYDLPSFANLTTFKVWAEEAPPKGTLYHYPNPHNHQTLSIAAAPAPHKIAEQIYTQAIQTQMVVRYAKGEAMEKTLDWAAGEIEGFSRN